jgi:hypothetical protein
MATLSSALPSKIVPVLLGPLVRLRALHSWVAALVRRSGNHILDMLCLIAKPRGNIVQARCGGAIARAKRSAGGDFERWVRGSFIGEAREGQACYSCFWRDLADRYHFNYNERWREV